MRDERSKPIVARIGERAMQVKALRESPIAKAIQYLENRWEGLQVYLRDPKVPITSNGIERALRGPVLGKKNSLGSRSERGLRSASVLYSPILSAKLCCLIPDPDPTEGPHFRVVGAHVPSCAPVAIAGIFGPGGVPAW